MGVTRIKANLNLKDKDVVGYCKKIVFDPNSIIYRKGKNFYVENDSIVLTINAYSYTIITAHKIKK